MIKICENCGKEFHAKPSDVGKFCNRSCHYDSRKNRRKVVIKLCAHCEQPMNFRAGLIRHRKFCSVECRTQFSEAHLPERFWKKIDKSSGPDACWPWIGIQEWGYGVIWRNSVKKFVKANRLAWEFAKGTIPEGFCVLHKCDNAICCNPSHLWLGTMQDNFQDMINKGRQARGERHPCAKLTESQVRTIRQLAIDGVTQKTIAIMFGFSEGGINHVISRRSWRHVK